MVLRRCRPRSAWFLRTYRTVSTVWHGCYRHELQAETVSFDVACASTVELPDEG